MIISKDGDTEIKGTLSEALTDFTLIVSMLKDHMPKVFLEEAFELGFNLEKCGYTDKDDWEIDVLELQKQIKESEEK